MQHSLYELKMTEFVIGELKGEELKEFQLHLDGCEECTISLASLKKVMSIYKAAPFDMPSEAYFASLVPQIREKLEKRDNLFSRYNIFFPARWAGAMAVVFIVAISTLLLFNLQNATQEEVTEVADIYYSGTIQIETYTIAAISATFESEDWDFLSEIIDDELGEYRYLFDYDSEDFYSVDILGNEEWEEFYEKFNNQQIL